MYSFFLWKTEKKGKGLFFKMFKIENPTLTIQNVSLSYHISTVDGCTSKFVAIFYACIPFVVISSKAFTLLSNETYFRRDFSFTSDILRLD